MLWSPHNFVSLVDTRSLPLFPLFLSRRGGGQPKPGRALPRVRGHGVGGGMPAATQTPAARRLAGGKRGSKMVGGCATSAQ